MAHLITNQNEDCFKKIKYGSFPVSFNGCGVMATYNAFILLGIEPPEFTELIATFRKLHMSVLFGLFGSNVYMTHKVLGYYGLGYKIVKLGDINEDGVYILSLWNKKPPFHGMHTVACQVKDGVPTTYNMYSNAGVVHEPLESLAGKRLIRAYRVLTN